jgi:hypothetical protein
MCVKSVRHICFPVLNTLSCGCSSAHASYQHLVVLTGVRGQEAEVSGISLKRKVYTL